jgi:hypothetical protein
MIIAGLIPGDQRPTPADVPYEIFIQLKPSAYPASLFCLGQKQMKKQKQPS